MEYEEDDEPDPVVEEVLEANAQIPNIPVPRSADGSVSNQVPRIVKP
jgi:RNA polymerase-associated protein LEO1